MSKMRYCGCGNGAVSAAIWELGVLAVSTRSLTPERGRIFRIVHRRNVPWILDHGLHCKSSEVRDPEFVSIGSTDVIRKREDRRVPVPPGGTLSDYVPFYFTPLSPMLLNIKTGWHGVTQRPMEEIVILVSSVPTIAASGTRFLITDRHAIYEAAIFSSDVARLHDIRWDLLQQRDFARDPEDNDKFECYQAEVLVYQHLPLSNLLGIVCYNDAVKDMVEGEIRGRGIALEAKAFPGWYF